MDKERTMHNNRTPIIGHRSYCFAPGCGMKREEEEEEKQVIVAISVVPKLGLESPILGDIVQEKKVDVKKGLGESKVICVSKRR